MESVSVPLPQPLISNTLLLPHSSLFCLSLAPTIFGSELPLPRSGVLRQASLSPCPRSEVALFRSDDTLHETVRIFMIPTFVVWQGIIFPAVWRTITFPAVWRIITLVQVGCSHILLINLVSNALSVGKSDFYLIIKAVWHWYEPIIWVFRLTITTLWVFFALFFVYPGLSGMIRDLSCTYQTSVLSPTTNAVWLLIAISFWILMAVKFHGGRSFRNQERRSLRGFFNGQIFRGFDQVRLMFSGSCFGWVNHAVNAGFCRRPVLTLLVWCSFPSLYVFLILFLFKGVCRLTARSKALGFALNMVQAWPFFINKKSTPSLLYFIFYDITRITPVFALLLLKLSLFYGLINTTCHPWLNCIWINGALSATANGHFALSSSNFQSPGSCLLYTITQQTNITPTSIDLHLVQIWFSSSTRLTAIRSSFFGSICATQDLQAMVGLLRRQNFLMSQISHFIEVLSFIKELSLHPIVSYFETLIHHISELCFLTVNIFSYPVFDFFGWTCFYADDGLAFVMKSIFIHDMQYLYYLKGDSGIFYAMHALLYPSLQALMQAGFKQGCEGPLPALGEFRGSSSYLFRESSAPLSLNARSASPTSKRSTSTCITAILVPVKLEINLMPLIALIALNSVASKYISDFVNNNGIMNFICFCGISTLVTTPGKFIVKSPTFPSKSRGKKMRWYVHLVTKRLISISVEYTHDLATEMRARLSGGHFRMINEKLYTCSGEEALEFFKDDPSLFNVYHTGYQEQMSHWPEQPVNIIIKWLKDHNPSLIVADFGCGDARLAKNVKNKVFSIDLVSTDPSVIECDMSSTPLESSSVDVAIFCLSLMGTNFPCYLREAQRVLKPSGWLLIAEVKSRFDPNSGGADPNRFVKAVCELGFTSVSKDFSNKMFILFFFKKKKQNSGAREIEWPELKPCIYKRR